MPRARGFVRADAWQLDLLGNWIGGAAAGTTGPPGGWGSEAPAAPVWVPDDGGRIAYGQLDAGTPGQTPDPAHEFRTWTHSVNEQNESRLIETAEGDQANPSPTPTQNWVRRDANGNVISDGTYYYQYDAWNRLIQINLSVRTDLPSGTELPPVPGEPPRLPGEMIFNVKPGLLVKHYSYDGLGRLVRTQSPWPNPQEGPITKQVKSERFFYDGIRRIQELVTDPVLSTKGALLSGDPGLIELAAAEGEVLGDEEEALEGEFVFDGDASSLKLEDGQAGANGAGGAPEGGGPPEYELVTYLAREYIWGPGDSHAGVDELLVYFDANRWAYWVLQDAGGDVVAVCDMNGIDPAGGNAARVCGQWRYDAYGAATAAEHLAAFPQIHCGHKALFFDRLDVGVEVSGAEPPRLIPYSHLLVHMRNRAYSPQMGRFMQPDPNATALTLIEVSSYHGRGLGVSPSAFSMMSLYSDGLSLFQYVGSRPWGRSDPLGLEMDEEEDPSSCWVQESMDAFALLDPLPGPSDFIREAARALVEDYAANLEWDVDWALDWDQPDDWHSRLDNQWVTQALGRGIQSAFDIDLPFTDRQVNPTDLFADQRKGGGWPSQRIGPIKGRFGSLKQVIQVGEFKVAIYTHPKYKLPVIEFPAEAIKDTTTIKVTGDTLRDTRAANKKLGKPQDYRWKAEYGEPCTWHHNWRKGRMELVPRRLNKAVQHIGGAAIHR